MTNLSAVILCGGQSRRMGRDKGLLTSEGTSWVATLQQEIASLSLPVYVSLRDDQQEAYRSVIPAEQQIVDQPWDGVAGPLVGILSAARRLPQQHLLVVPCDMPKLRQDTLARWIATFRAHRATHQAFISQTTHRWQPLCGIYHRRGLELLLDRYQRGTLHNQSMHAILENVLTTYAIAIPPALTDQFANYNTPDDL